MIVVDAGVIASALGDDGPDGDTARRRLRGEKVAAPGLLDLEVVSVFRRLLAAGLLGERRAQFALGDLMRLPVERAPHPPLLGRCWELRHNLTVYDAAYVALAEAMGAILVTADFGIAHAPGLRCEVDFLQ